MIKVTDLNKTYDRHSGNANHVLKNVSFTLPDTGFVCILGQSGCGKTSLLNAVGGLDHFDSGSIQTEHITVSRSGTALFEAERNRSFGYIFQNYNRVVYQHPHRQRQSAESYDIERHAENLHKAECREDGCWNRDPDDQSRTEISQEQEDDDDCQDRALYSRLPYRADGISYEI